MKKLYRKGTVHPSPPVISNHLSFLPATILTLTAALSPEDREVLAYLISCSNNNISVNNFPGHRKNCQQKNVSFPKSKSTFGNNNSDHPPLFTCDCFRCYMSYWVRWDSSPNRQLIHEIIDALEDELLQQKNKKMKNSKKDKKKRSGNENSGELKRNNNNNHQQSRGKESAKSASVEENSAGRMDDDGDHHENCTEGEEKSSVRSFMSFIGEQIWGVWG